MGGYETLNKQPAWAGRNFENSLKFINKTLIVENRTITHVFRRKTYAFASCLIFDTRLLTYAIVNFNIPPRVTRLLCRSKQKIGRHWKFAKFTLI